MIRPSRRQLLAGSLGLAAVRGRFNAALQDGTQPARAADYDLRAGLTYLNHASIGTSPRAVREAHAGYLAECESNPWLHVWGDAWVEAIEETHALAARFLGCDTVDLAIIRNTTAAFGMAANGMEALYGERNEVLFGSLNHVGASASWEHAAAARGYVVRRFEFPERDVPGATEDDVVRIYAEALSEQTAVLVLPHVDNVIGLRHPIAAIARMARERGVRWICVDGAQSIGMHPVEVRALGVDLYATSAHKWLQAPKGTGLMFVSPALRARMRPMVATWGQERWAESARKYADFGTRDLPALLALGDAIRFQTARCANRDAHDRALFDHARARIRGNAKLSWRSPRFFDNGGAIYAVGVEGADANELAKALFVDDEIVVRPFGGSQRSHLRVSPNTFNGVEDLDRFFEAVERRLA